MSRVRRFTQLLPLALFGRPNTAEMIFFMNRFHSLGDGSAAGQRPLGGRIRTSRRFASDSSINPVGKRPVRESGCYLNRRQVASFDRRISTGTNPDRGSIMLRMVLLGLLIPLGVGVLAGMELRTPPRAAVTVVQPIAETTVGISDSRGALAKADRLEITYAKSETPTQPGLVDERISPSEATTIGSPEAPRILNRHRHDPKTKKVTTAALPKSKPKTTDIRRTAVPDRSKAASVAEPCRLSAFGGLRRALNSSGCEI
jgi:hypothetical protein